MTITGNINGIAHHWIFPTAGVARKALKKLLIRSDVTDLILESL